ncbi:hypothetical protein DFH27DRAFT_601634 [Peziza echinospora]|nr:hypothetical protein DFH27DRAFT_601634 [Peziza echinospora]
MQDTCAHCNKSAADAAIDKLKVCGGCRGAMYCSTDCQKAEWKTHKKECRKGTSENTAPSKGASENAGSSTGASPKSGPSKGSKGSNRANPTPTSVTENPLYGVLQNPVMGLSQKETYRRLIDSFRLRLDDECNWWGRFRGAYDSDEEADPRVDFHDFLLRAENKELRWAVQSEKGLLPKWWDEEKRTECEKIAGAKTNREGLYHKTEKADIIEAYGDSLMPMKLRLLADIVEGKTLMGGPS